MLLLYQAIQAQEKPGCKIYIPLCFYFILSNYATTGAVDVFTFHYASTLSSRIPLLQLHDLRIYIPLCFYFIPGDRCGKGILQYPFTFHYASTLSCRHEYKCEFEFNLHSTMLLLYLQRQIRTRNRISIYIPLCFYFIRRTMQT